MVKHVARGDRKARLGFNFACFVICFDVLLLAYSKTVVCSGRQNHHTKLMKSLTLRLLMAYIYGAPSKARNANVVYVWTYVWQR